MSKILKIGHWTPVVAAIFLMGWMGRPQDVLAHPASNLKTTPGDDDVSVALHMDSPLSDRFQDTGLHRIHDVESDLDHVFADVSDPEYPFGHDQPENFVGGFTVNASSSHPHTTH